QFFGFDLQSATGTSLGAQLLPVSLFAVIAYYRAGRLQIVVASFVAVGLVLGSWIGAEVALALPTRTLQLLYGLFLVYVGWRFGEPRRWLAERRNGVIVANASAEPESRGSWYLLLLIGTV